MRALPVCRAVREYAEKVTELRLVWQHFAPLTFEKRIKKELFGTSSFAQKSANVRFFLLLKKGGKNGKK